jgi:dienelactone hydrolase
LRAGLAWLRAAPGADASRLAVIGAGLGGNLACVASGLSLARSSVALSPDRDNTHLLAGHRPLHMQSLLLLATSGDPGRESEVRRLYLEARQPKDVHVFTDQERAAKRSSPCVPSRPV